MLRVYNWFKLYSIDPLIGGATTQVGRRLELPTQVKRGAIEKQTRLGGQFEGLFRKGTRQKEPNYRTTKSHNQGFIAKNFARH